jgi:hypothetical protein
VPFTAPRLQGVPDRSRPHEGIKYRAPAPAQHIGQDTAQFEVGVSQHLLDTQGDAVVLGGWCFERRQVALPQVARASGNEVPDDGLGGSANRRKGQRQKNRVVSRKKGNHPAKFNNDPDIARVAG